MKLRPVNKCECGEHAWVPLTRGHVAMVDAAFATAVGQWNWYAKRDRGNWYAARTEHFTIDGQRRTIMIPLHAVICPVTSSYLVDHIDGDTLNNRRSNLRPATTSQNARNQRRRADTTSVFRGVSRAGAWWKVTIGVRGVQHYLGRFASEIDAARAYDAAAQQYHGDFARLNFPADERRVA